MWFNAHDGDIRFTAPAEEFATFWEIVVDTSSQPSGRLLEASCEFTVEARSLLVLVAHEATSDEPDTSAAASIAAGSAPGSIDEPAIA